MEILYLNTADTHKIRMTCFAPDTKPKGVIQFVHGFGEGLEHFADLAKFLMTKGYAFVVHDQRGFGKEAYRRGVHGSYENFLNDIEIVREWIGQKFPQVPVVLFGFSMGGNISSNYILKRGSKCYQALVLESPWLSLDRNPQKATIALAKFLGNLSKNLRIKSGLNVQAIMRDKARLSEVLTDGIYHDTISMRLFSEVREHGEYALANANKIKIPTLLLGAEQDKIVSIRAIRTFAERADKNIKYHEIAGGYHCLHYDLGYDQTQHLLVGFLDGILKN
ncbi:alpha/beta hydrolase [Lactococcus protaetiae]|uniref:Lysophospholipase n=1 Tax=Lactococcus protaetiae TaxID=2592653 RepID=A0A514Z7F2_9LACT|nr:alpha/beta hydrolase [Lactococcus protaetiae]QDK70504.1 lysophospholipase [Lactococcus protaetiae]